MGKEEAAWSGPKEPALCAEAGSLGDECIFGVFRKISFFYNEQLSSQGGKGREGQMERSKAGRRRRGRDRDRGLEK